MTTPRPLTFVSVHPRFFAAYFEVGVFKSAVRAGHVDLRVVDLRDHAVDDHASVDASPYGGGDGMVLRPEPLRDAISTSPGAHIIATSPGGKLFRQRDARRLLELSKPLTFVCGRFGGIDQRFIDKYVHEEFSIGDFVVSGGELPSLLIADSILRLIPGVLGNPVSAVDDSFGEASPGLLEHPLYTRPAVFEGMNVPEVLLSGDHAKIAAWRREKALERTRRERPDLLQQHSNTERKS